MKKIAFIFDLDGVIVDTAKYHFLAWRNLANQLGFEFTEEHNELLKGVSRVKSLEILLNIGKVEISEEEKQKYLIKKNEEYLGYVNKMTDEEILPGVKGLLDFLDENKITYALGSASKNAPLILEKVGLYNRFTAIVDGNDVSKAKPDPEVFLIGAKKLEMNAENCVVVEDAIAGVEAAKAANMTCVGIGEQEVLGQADFVFNDMTGFTPDFLNQLIN
ncbi:beta-phosphoglucomutase [Lutibacter sp. TH_r2]|uniref:beta-phosphoglucomutase n=1 Tax=Lutibacter sp. TH_r2 TaxID=3082083 RepID=UPI0029546C0D|nr:beta-phosphoglucomutase [Lutibacter sp. TH_r2]MDV7188560.1 beta-phosphoglucomutase [Lutibacter sp. TH_r2]